MSEVSSTLEYAEEVYAACATIGFDKGPAAVLKALLDRIAARQDVDEGELLRVAQQAHLAAANWAGR